MRGRVCPLHYSATCSQYALNHGTSHEASILQGKRAKIGISLTVAMAVTFTVLSEAQLTGSTAQRAPSIYSIKPALGVAGNELTINGFGFSTSNTVHFGNKSIGNVSIAWQAGITCVAGSSDCHPGINQALIVTIPQDGAPGMYDISVENPDGISNVVVFTIVGAADGREH
jgi:hypothetical protein